MRKRFERLSQLSALAWLILSALAAPSFAEKRVALVIGNSTYQHATKLPNPPNDAAAMTVLFNSAGFDIVETRNDLGVAAMRRAVRDFSDAARDADIAVVFYAGHGIEVNGANYLLPVDVKLERDLDVEDETVSLERLLQVIEPARRLRLIILDACRDNPFMRGMKRTIASRAIGRGLASVEPVQSDTLISFAAKAGSTAGDGAETHSPFTAALLKHLATPGLDLRIALGRMRDEVLEKTGRTQEPFVYGSLGGTTVALLPAIATDAQPLAPGVQAPALDPAAHDYELAAQVGTKEAWEAFLVKHANGFYADLARIHLGKIVLPTADPKAKVGAIEPGSQPSQKSDARETYSNPQPQKPPKSVQKISSGSCTANGWTAAECSSARTNRSLMARHNLRCQTKGCQINDSWFRRCCGG